MKQTAQKARERASVILQVRTGQISASEGARLLGVTRKTYYQWEKRALEGMMAQLEEHPPGRPQKEEINPEREAMRQKIASLEAQLKTAEQTAEVRAILLAMRKKEEQRSLKKKEAQIRTVLLMSQTIQRTSRLTSRQLCDHLEVSHATLLRWRRRAKDGLPLLARPGPKKLGPLPFEEIRCEVAQLIHGKKRTAGAGQLYRRLNGLISRRDLGRLIIDERQKQNGERRQNLKRIVWKEPNLAWAIDATEYGRDSRGHKLTIVATKDMASCYCFESMVAVNPCGEQVARHLLALIRRHGPPLFLKRDNGSLFNNQAVDAILAQECVIPLNSPPYYPPYNGAIEKGIRELKDQLNQCIPAVLGPWEPHAVASFANAAAHLRNCRPRRILGGHTAAETYHHQARSRFGKRERHATFEWIKLRSDATIKQMDKPDLRAVRASWRLAAESWLRCQGLITLSLNGKVLPHLPLKLSS